MNCHGMRRGVVIGCTCMLMAVIILLRTLVDDPLPTDLVAIAGTEVPARDTTVHQTSGAERGPNGDVSPFLREASAPQWQLHKDGTPLKDAPAAIHLPTIDRPPVGKHRRLGGVHLPPMQQPPQPFLTTYRKTHCGAFVTNMCIVDGQPRYTTEDGLLLTRSGATTVCNEAVKKSKLHMVVKRPQDRRGPVPGRYMGDDAVLLVPFCWELYGYHLLLCLLSVWANRCRLDAAWCAAEAGGVAADDGSHIVVVGFLKGSGLFPYLRGSATSWDNTTPPVVGASGSPLPSKAQSTPYWPLWQVLANDPAFVAPLPDLPPMCFRRAYLGHLPSFDVLPHEQQLFRRATVRRLLGQGALDSEQRPSFNNVCKPGGGGSLANAVRVTLIQRATRYRILNVDAVKQAILRGMTGGGLGLPPVVRVVLLETHSVLKQLRMMALETDVLVGVHGNGLSWSMFMPPATAVIELWPHAPYNTNYPTFCTRSNLFYTAVNGNATCRARCSALYTEPAVEAAARLVAQHLWRTRCQGLSFNATAQFFEAKEQAAQKKRERLLAGR